MKNTLVYIGFTGDYSCYLNVPKDEAIKRYLIENDWVTQDEAEASTKEFTFVDEFYAYEVGSKT